MPAFLGGLAGLLVQPPGEASEVRPPGRQGGGPLAVQLGRSRLREGDAGAGGLLDSCQRTRPAGRSPTRQSYSSSVGARTAVTVPEGTSAVVAAGGAGPPAAGAPASRVSAAHTRSTGRCISCRSNRTRQPAAVASAAPWSRPNAST